jgi:DNA helicase-2/ATP-dependent DNA helicase PcrA
MIINKNLDIYQKKAVYTEDNNVLIVAPPGSGKTTVTINRVAYLINHKGINPDNMIVITFTKAAASNMKERYLKLTSRKPPFFGTFHALFYKILSRYLKNINIINTSATYKLIKGVLVSYLDSVNDEKVREVINDISLFKNSSDNIESYNSKIDKGIFKDCLNTYETYKEENCLMDFDDLQLRAKKLFIESPEILAGYRKLFKYILVDEVWIT